MTTTDGRSERKHRRRDPCGTRSISEDGLACQIVHERNRASDVDYADQENRVSGQVATANGRLGVNVIFPCDFKGFNVR